jgi:CTP synthase (UTP-ammonia lyase)
VLPGTRAAELYRAPRVVESYMCNYGIAPEWEERFAAGGMRVSARGDDGEVRIIELDEHPFFLATLFLPQLQSTAGAPHPLLRAFVEAARGSGRQT